MVTQSLTQVTIPVLGSNFGNFNCVDTIPAPNAIVVSYAVPPAGCPLGWGQGLAQQGPAGAVRRLRTEMSRHWCLHQGDRGASDHDPHPLPGLTGPVPPVGMFGSITSYHSVF